MRLKEKVAIVTGGGIGIGKAIALAFAKEGAIIVVTSRNITNLKNAASEIKDNGGEATAIEANIADEKQVQEMIAHTIRKYQKVDILVNNSGVAGPTIEVADLNLKDWNETLMVDLTGAMLCTREGLKHMIPRQSGSIINISSRLGRYGLAMRSPYTVAKSGLISLTETLSMEVGKYGIRVNCLAPGPISGQRNDYFLETTAAANGLPVSEFSNRITSRISLRRFLNAQEIALPAVFLASEESSGITGQTITVDGGTNCI